MGRRPAGKRPHGGPHGHHPAAAPVRGGAPDQLGGWALPSVPVTYLTAGLMAVLYTLVPRAAGATSAAHPGARYLLVTEFFEGATELGEAEVDEQVVDDGRSATAACS